MNSMNSFPRQRRRDEYLLSIPLQRKKIAKEDRPPSVMPALVEIAVPPVPPPPPPPAAGAAPPPPPPPPMPPRPGFWRFPGAEYVAGNGSHGGRRIEE